MRKILISAIFGVASVAMAQITMSNVQVGNAVPNSYTDVLSGSKLPGAKMLSSQAEYQSIGAGATVTLIDYTGSGYVSNFWLNINGDANANFASTVNVYYDGEGSPSISVPVAYFFGAPGASGTLNNALHSRLFDDVYDSADFEMNWAAHIPMPFATEIKITLTNNGAAVSSGLFWNIQYETGVGNAWTNTHKLKIATLQGTTCTLNSIVDLLNLASGAGRLLGTSFYLSGGGSNTSLQEGDFYLYLNGDTSVDFQSTGFEDFFEMGHNFKGFAVGNSLFNGQEGLYLWNGTSFPSDPVAAYRFHIDDPIIFNNGIKWQWQCGESGRGSSGSGTLKVSVFYYL